MYKLLVVDDEKISREGLTECIDWEKYQVRVIGAAQNGKEAMAIITAQHPDLVIIDVKMPLMDGITLIDQARTLSPDTIFVVLSGHGEFEYAQKAMRCGVKHYLLKPCSEEQIAEMLVEIKAERLQKQRLDNLIKTINENMENMPDAVRELFPPDFATWADKDQLDYLETRHGNIAQIIIRYVQTHYADPNLSLKQLAHEVIFMNDGYLGKLFKKEVGEKFTQYVLKVRMENAKYLIENSDGERLYEVATQVGLGENPQYFSQVFKKYVGYTPSEYKRTLQQNPQIIEQN